MFAAGDCRTKEIRQLTTAAADGAVAALAACNELAEQEREAVPEERVLTEQEQEAASEESVSAEQGREVVPEERVLTAAGNETEEGTDA